MLSKTKVAWKLADKWAKASGVKTSVIRARSWGFAMFMAGLYLEQGPSEVDKRTNGYMS